MGATSQQGFSQQGLKAGSVGPAQIFVFIFATTAPMVGLVGSLPVALTHGNGVGQAGCLLLLGAAYLVFAVGFAALTRRVVDAGTFYACAARGLSPRAGLIAAAFAVTAYMALQLCCYALIGFFLERFSERLWGEGLPWWFNALLINAVVPFCAQRSLRFAAWLLGFLALGEFVTLSAFALSVLIHGGGPDGLTARPFAPSQVFSSGFGAAMAFAVAAFTGMESAPVYAEEARRPRSDAARAMYAAIVVIAVTTAVSVWALAAAYGPQRVVEAAARDPGDLWFAVAPHYLPAGLVAAMPVLLTTSLFAALVGMQNVVSRYLYALGRDGAIPAELARMHPVQETPYIANLAQASVSILALAGLGLIEGNPLRLVVGASSALGASALLCAQILASLAAIGFFRAGAEGGVGGVWATRIAPGLSVVLLSALLGTILVNLPALTGGTAAASWTILAALPTIAIGAAAHASWLKRRRPRVYAGLARRPN